MKRPVHVSDEAVRRAARIYSTNKDMAAALDIHPGQLSRACKKAGVQTPYQRTGRLTDNTPAVSSEEGRYIDRKPRKRPRSAHLDWNVF